MNIRIAAVLLAAATSVTSACTTVPLNPNYHGPQPLPAHFNELTLPPAHTEATVTLLNKSPTVATYTVTLNGSRSVLSIPRGLYRAIEGKKCPLVMIMPGMGGGELITNAFVEGCVDTGIAAMVLEQPEFLRAECDGQELERRLESSTQSARALVDWICSQQFFDAEHIGSIGYSMGAIRGMVLAAVEPRISHHVFIMGAGDLPRMILESRETSRYVVERKKRECLSDEQLLWDLERIVLDPCDLAPSIDARKVLMVVSRFDTIVPTLRQEEVRELMGGPRTIYIPTGHFTAVVTLPYLKGKMAEFYRKEFEK